MKGTSVRRTLEIANATVGMLDPVLTPGQVIRVNRVTFCPGHPGQTRFKNYPGLTQIGSREPQN